MPGKRRLLTPNPELTRWSGEAMVAGGDFGECSQGARFCDAMVHLRNESSRLTTQFDASGSCGRSEPRDIYSPADR
jgi:hypothetical protein